MSNLRKKSYLRELKNTLSMKFLISLLISFAALSSLAQDNKPDESIYRGIKLMKRATSDMEYKMAIDSFDVAVSKNPKDWVSKYYAALGRVYLVESNYFKEVSNRDAYLKQANDLLTSANKLSNDEEILILKAFITANQLSRATESEKEKLYVAINDQLAKIRSINAANPRCMLVEGMMHFYGPEHLGGPNQSRNILMQARQIFTDGEYNRYMFMPTWGEKFVAELLAKIGE